MKKWFLFCAFFSIFFVPGSIFAQELVLDRQVTVKARVLEVVEQESRVIPGTDTEGNFQTLKVKILEGEEAGKEIVVENDYLNLKTGEVFYLMHTIDELYGHEYYAVMEPYRLPTLFFFIGLFIVCVLVFGGLQGLRGLLALFGSFLFIFFLLFPGILHGYSPILMSLGVSSLIVVLGSYITHGFNRTTSAAVLGMIATIGLTGILAYLAVHLSHLSGFDSEEVVYLNFDTRGSIDMVGLLIGGILIGLLGVLYDAGIAQSIAVEELRRAGPELSNTFILKRALRMGREHIGALVNTLAIAYVGASLPLLLLFYSSTGNVLMTINREIFAAEIIRTIVGSIGVVLVVPITTVIALFMLSRNEHASK